MNIKQTIKKVLQEEINIPTKLRRRLDSLDNGLVYLLGRYYSDDDICEKYVYDEYVQVISDAIAERMYHVYFRDLDEQGDEWDEIYTGIMNYIENKWEDRLIGVYNRTCGGEEVLLEEYSLPVQVRRRMDLSDDNIILLLRDMVLRIHKGDKVVTLVNVISEVASGMMYDAGLIDTEYNTSEVHKTLVKYINNKFGDYIDDYYDELFSGDDDERYIFYKHADRHGGNGYTEGVTGWYNFLHKNGYRLPMIDWSKVREKLKTMPRGQKLLLSSPGDSNNGNWGYYFSISMK